MALLFVFLFLLGTIIGSFLNVLVLRLQTGETVVRGRSRCFSCGHELGAFELVPVVSFLLLRGRCKHCSSKISRQYALVELASGLLFVLVGWKVLELGAWNSGPGLQIHAAQAVSYFYWVTVFSLLLAISVYDIRHKIIPNQVVYPFIVLAILSGSLTSINTEVGLPDFVSQLLSGVGAFLFFAGLWGFSRGKWMGFGDAKLALGIGFFLGYPLTIAAVVFSFWIGTALMLPLVLARGRSLKMQIPFAPFLALSAFGVWLWGPEITLLLGALFPF